MLTVLTVFSALVWILITLLPARPSRLKATWMPVPPGTPVRGAIGPRELESSSAKPRPRSGWGPPYPHRHGGGPKHFPSMCCGSP
jgi:hypothetical protein